MFMTGKHETFLVKKKNGQNYANDWVKQDTLVK